MHSLEQIKFMNTPAEIAKRQKLARAINQQTLNNNEKTKRSKKSS